MKYNTSKFIKDLLSYTVDRTEWYFDELTKENKNFKGSGNEEQTIDLVTDAMFAKLLKKEADLADLGLPVILHNVVGNKYKQYHVISVRTELYNGNGSSVLNCTCEDEEGEQKRAFVFNELDIHQQLILIELIEKHLNGNK